MIEAVKVLDSVKLEWFAKHQPEDNPAEWVMYRVGDNTFIGALGPVKFKDLHTIETEGRLVVAEKPPQEVSYKWLR